MDTRGIITRRSAAAVGAIALVVGLAGCDVTLTRAHSTASITRTCQGEPDHHGTAPVQTQVLVTVDADETEPYDIDISLNDGALTSEKDDAGPGSGVALTDNVVNTVEIDITVAPSDGTGTTDTYHQIFNPC
jgi:hypothetical protein